MGALSPAASFTLTLALAAPQAGGQASAVPAEPPAIRAAAAAALVSRPSQPIDPVARWRPFTSEASRRFGVPLAWIERVIRAESGGRTQLNGRPVTSRAGAMGLMQLMPATWAELRARLRLGADPHDPRDNILAGTFYLRLMYDRFGYPGLFGAYNSGPARYAEWLAGRRALPAETRAYLAALAGAKGGDGAGGVAQVPGTSAPATSGPPANPAPPAAALFVVRRDSPPSEPTANDPARPSLFVTLSSAPREPKE